MLDINALKALYFADAAEANPPSEPIPATEGGCNVTPLIGGTDYFAELDAVLAVIGTGATPSANAKHFIYISKWYLDLTGSKIDRSAYLLGSKGEYTMASQTGKFSLDPPSLPKNPKDPITPGSHILLDILKAKAKAGVDVRVLGWVSPMLLNSTIAQNIESLKGMLNINVGTLRSVDELRKEEALQKKVCLNILGHPAGAVHLKLAVIGNDVNTIAFTGGLDLSNLRHSTINLWRDVQARVEGPIVQSLYDCFVGMWNEIVDREIIEFNVDGIKIPSCVAGTEKIPARSLAINNAGYGHHVQSLRTIPQANFAPQNILAESKPISYAPKGIFEVRIAWRRALQVAEQYIYMEDQSFWGAEILSWINEAIKINPALRVILVAPGQKDPNDPAFREQAILTESINKNLLGGLTPSQIEQVGLFQFFITVPIVEGSLISVVKLNGTSNVITDLPTSDQIEAGLLSRRQFTIRTGQGDFTIADNPVILPGMTIQFTVNNRSGNVIPPTGEFLLCQPSGVMVHSKTTLVDDHWALIGSANCMRRSLYTDFEHAISFLDKSDKAVREYRMALWATALGVSPNQLDDIDKALNVWEPKWGKPGSGLVRPAGLVRVPLPLSPEATLNWWEAYKYNNIDDFDSRENWGGLCP